MTFSRNWREPIENHLASSVRIILIFLTVLYLKDYEKCSSQFFLFGCFQKGFIVKTNCSMTRHSWLELLFSISILYTSSTSHFNPQLRDTGNALTIKCFLWFPIFSVFNFTVIFSSFTRHRGTVFSSELHWPFLGQELSMAPTRRTGTQRKNF